MPLLDISPLEKSVAALGRAADAKEFVVRLRAKTGEAE